jgi:hypothetical protein
MVLALAERKGNNGSKDHGKEKHNHIPACICMSAQSAKDMFLVFLSGRHVQTCHLPSLKKSDGLGHAQMGTEISHIKN